MPLHDVLRQRFQPLSSAVTSNRIFLYAVFSLFAVVGTIANACRAHSNFYSVSIYLSKSSRSVLVLANFAFLCALLCGRIFQRIFFGPLQPREVERLYDQTWMFVTESLLAFTIFRDEFDVPFLLMFGFLLFVKCFHWLMADRVESMDQTPYPGPPTLFHIRINGLFVVLWAIDMTMFAFAVESTLTNGVGGMVLFASEYSILLASALNAMLRYALSLLDLRRARTRGGENAPPWENKSMYIFYIELLTDFLKLATYMTFFMIILTFYGLPLNIIRDVFVTARSFITRLRALVRYHNATRDMDRRYPDATEAELAEMSDRTCIICREEMHSRAAAGQTEQGADADRQQQTPLPPADGPNMTPKKLPCGHIFHFQCLRSWLERQQSCPTCRRTVLENNTPQNARQAPNQGQQGPAPPQPGAAPGAQQQGRPVANGPVGWVGRFFGIPQAPILDNQFPGAQGRLPQGAPAPPFQQQQHALPNGGWVGPVPGQAPPPPPPPGFFDPTQAWQHHAGGGQAFAPPPLQQPPVFNGFYGPGHAWQPWGDPRLFGQQQQQQQQDAAAGTPPAQTHQPPYPPPVAAPTGVTEGDAQARGTIRNGGTSQAPTPTPTTAPTPSPAVSSSSGSEARNGGNQTLDSRHAAALAALRRFNPAAAASAEAAMSGGRAPQSETNAPAVSSSQAPSTATPLSTPAAGPSSAPNTAQTSSSAIPALIPLYDTGIVQPTRVPGAHHPYYTPYNPIYRPSGARPPSGSQRPSLSARATRTPLAQLPPTLTEEQLARLDRLTRDAIDERLRVLEGVSGAVWRCMEELTRVRSVLPVQSTRRTGASAEQQARGSASASTASGSESSSGSGASEAGTSGSASGSASVESRDGAGEAAGTDSSAAPSEDGSALSDGEALDVSETRRGHALDE
ncbi:hypothetical protein C8Q78DRAFT_1059101 [Trametes maxima]|nr:hypothetical protein C8Q78DRAFT_1059101 [Trametes maxima]